MAKKPSGSQSNVVSGRKDFLAAAKRLQAQWKSARKVKDEGRGASAAKIIKSLDLQDGETANVVALLTDVRTGKDKKNNPYVSFSFTGQRGPAAKLKFDIFRGLGARTRKSGEVDSAESQMERLFVDLQRLDYDTDDLELDQEFFDILDELMQDKPLCQLSVKRSEEYVNVYLNKRLVEEGDESEEEEDEESDDEGAAEDDAAVDAATATADADDDVDDEDGPDEPIDKPETDSPEPAVTGRKSRAPRGTRTDRQSAKRGAVEEDDEDDDEEEAAEEDAEDEDETPAKDDAVLYQAPRAKSAAECQVLVVNATKETATLRRLEDGREFKNVSWSDFKIVYED